MTILRPFLPLGRYTAALIVIPLLLLGACGGSNQQLENEIRRLENEIRRLESVLESEPPSTQSPAVFAHGLDEDGVRSAFHRFFGDSGIADGIEEKLGLRFRPEDMDIVFLHHNYLIVRETSWLGGMAREGYWLGGLYFFFQYRADIESGEVEFDWFGYEAVSPVYLSGEWPFGRFTLVRQREIPTPRRLTDLPEVTVRFHFFPYEEPYGDVLYHYTEETINGGVLWEETIRLIAEHNHIMVRDLWYEGSTLYVDLKLGMLRGFFDMGWASVIWAESLIETFYSFPGVSDVIFLLDGMEHPGIFDGLSLNMRRPWLEMTWWYD
jgi:hypothetical protein